jgi:hypothetical protein
LDGSVVFRYERRIALSFLELTSRVEVSRSVQMMNDYIGGASVPVQRDERGRITHQATRTIYLPQPNFQVLVGAKPIDVSKLEYSRYDAHEHRVVWRTVKSLNESAIHDDGSVSFRDTGDGDTVIAIVARQKFALAPFWHAVQIDLHDRFKRAVVEHGYRDYFARTIANFEAAYEGRAFRTGREPGETPTEPWKREMQLSRALRGALGSPTRASSSVDEHGFTCFDAQNSIKPPRSEVIAAAAQVVRDLAQALRKDWPGLPSLPEAGGRRE